MTYTQFSGDFSAATKAVCEQYGLNQKIADKNDQGGVLVLDYRKPLDAAKEFSKVGQKKIYWQGCLYEFTGTHYQEKSTDDIKSLLYRFLDDAKVLDKEGGTVPYLPNRNRVNEILDALKATINSPDTLKPPVFLNGGDGGQEFISMRNGLLNIENRQLIESTPEIFYLEQSTICF